MEQQVVTFGEILMRLSAPAYQRLAQAQAFHVHYGGGEANVAASLANYGIPVSFVSRIPANDPGMAVLQHLRAFNIDTKYILQGGKRLGLYFLEKGAVSRGSKVTYDREHSAFAEIRPGMVDWETVFKDAFWFHWSGITPALSQEAADACLEAVRKANEMGVTVSCDLNYRHNLWNYGRNASEIMPALTAGCDIVVGDEYAVQKMLDIEPETGGEKIQQYESISRQIVKQYPRVDKIALSMRHSVSASHNTFSAFLWDGQQSYQAPVFDITHIVDRVGGGDAFTGGLIYGLHYYRKDDQQQALNFAAAAASLKHTIEGDFNRVTAEEVAKLMQGDTSGRISR